MPRRHNGCSQCGGMAKSGQVIGLCSCGAGVCARHARHLNGAVICARCLRNTPVAQRRLAAPIPA